MKRSVNQALAAAVLGLGLAGGVVIAQTPTATTGTSTATAQVSTATTTGTATSPAASGTSTTQNQPGQQGQAGQMGPGGRGPGGPGGPGGQAGPRGGQPQAPTTASVTTEIGNLTQQFTSVKADRDFANSKMDLTTVNALIDKATALQTQAQTALTANNLTLASGDARAAGSALRSADDLIVASIGSTGLPSAANRPARATPAASTSTTATTPTAPTADQQKARSSNELARTYQQIVDEGKTVNANSSSAAGDLSFYVTTAQSLYKQAYDLYNAGKYDQASQTVRAAGSVAGIAGELLHAAGVMPTGPQVVAVPAPTF